MKCLKICHGFALMLIIQLVLFGSLALAGTEATQQPLSSQEVLLGDGLGELTIDHSQLFADLQAKESRLFAMASSSGSNQDYSAAKRRGGDCMATWHKYLGYGTVLLAGVTAATSSQESFHEGAAYATAAGAVSTVLTGYLAHRDRFDTGDGLLTRDNIHIALGTLGAALLTTAVAIADDGEESSHSGLGVTGGVMMALGVIDIKW
jgi:hypothetical protein